MAYDYQEGLPNEAKTRYKMKLNLVGINQCPYKEPADKWTNDMKEWPATYYGDIYHYLIKSPRLYSPEAMENYKSLDAHVFFTSGWVQTVYHYKTSRGDFILKADVKPSWRVTEEPHHPWVALSKDGKVLTAHCDCMAGLGETCSHIGAVLYKVEAAVRLGFTTSACTDLPCQWNECYVKDVEPAPIASIKFYSEKAKKKLRESTRVHRDLPRPATDEEQHRFLQSIKHLGTAVVGLSAWSDYNEAFIEDNSDDLAPVSMVPDNLRTLYEEKYTTISKADMVDLCNDIYRKHTITPEEIKSVEEKTRLQSSSSAWHEVRTGRITASVAGDIMQTSIAKPSSTLLQKICNPSDQPLRVPAIEWGRENEENAYELYRHVVQEDPRKPKLCPSGNVYVADHVGLQHSEAQLAKSGLLLSPNKPHFGASPDGIITCLCCGLGALEIKCPFSCREKTMEDNVSKENFCLDDTFSLKKKHKYYAQVQLQMYVADAQYVDLVVWTPVDCVITRVIRDDPFITDMETKLDTFWLHCVLPELLTRQLENASANSQSSTVGNNSKVYCLCRSPSEEEPMVGCDACDEWFHIRCLKLKRVPRSRVWYCKSCRNKKRQKKQ